MAVTEHGYAGLFMYRFHSASETGRDGEGQAFACQWMVEADAFGMKAHLSVPAASVEQVSENRASEPGGCMYPELVSPSGERPEFHQCQFRSAVRSCAVVRFCSSVKSCHAVRFCLAVLFVRCSVAG